MADPRSDSQSRGDDFNEATRWNFTVMAAESAVFQTAMSWVDPIAVLPLFINRLAQSTVLVGLVTALQRLGWILPQLPMAAILGHRPRRLPYLQWGVFFGRLPFLAFVVYLWIWGVRSPGVVLAFMMVAYLSVALGNGVVSVSWQDIIAKSIPGTLRGRFFATMQFATAIGALGVGFGVRMMLGPEARDFPSTTPFSSPSWPSSSASRLWAALSHASPSVRFSTDPSRCESSLAAPGRCCAITAISAVSFSSPFSAPR